MKKTYFTRLLNSIKSGLMKNTVTPEAQALIDEINSILSELQNDPDIEYSADDLKARISELLATQVAEMENKLKNTFQIKNSVDNVKYRKMFADAMRNAAGRGKGAFAEEFNKICVKNGITSTTAPVDIKGTKLTLMGIGLTADTGKETVRIEKDVTGYILTEKGRYRFESDSFTYFLKDSTYVLAGRVVMKGEDMNLLCDKLVVFSSNNEVDKVDATGKVRLISKGTIAKSEKAVYHFREDRIVLTERPKILKNNVEMEGESIMYSLSSGKFFINKPKTRIDK